MKRFPVRSRRTQLYPCHLLQIHVLIVSLVLLSTVCVASAAQYPIKVTNHHPTEALWVRVSDNNSGELRAVKLKAGQSYTYQVNVPWESGRVYGCWEDTTGIPIKGNEDRLQHSCGLVEGSIYDKGNINLDITYVDYISIPAQTEISGCLAGNPVSYCDSSNPQVPTTCRVTSLHTVDQLKDCPTKLFGRSCQNPTLFCGQNSGNPMCSQFAGLIRKCIQTPGKYPGCAQATGLDTTDVYGCSGYFSSDQGKRYCAAMNRGVFSMDSSKWDDVGGFYKTRPYNAFAQWTHKISGSIYAFPYDDVKDQSGDLGCTQSSSAAITFYPLKKKAIRSYLGKSESATALEPGSESVSNTEPAEESIQQNHTEPHDQQSFQFAGIKGERVVLELFTSPRLTRPVSLKLMTVDRKLIAKVVGRLPQRVNLILPKAATYVVVVDNLPGLKGKDHHHFVGPYVLSLKSSKDAWSTIRALR